MINTTITVASSDGSHRSEETVIVQSAGDMDMEEDVSSHRNACSAMLGSVEHAVQVTLERIQDEIDKENPDREPPMTVEERKKMAAEILEQTLHEAAEERKAEQENDGRKDRNGQNGHKDSKEEAR